jgi:branched-chain amino acid aminotransferase
MFLTGSGQKNAASRRAQAEAIRNGCDQTMFLDGAERRWVEELGGMNVFSFLKMLARHAAARRHHPAGITRDSLITLTRDQGLRVREEPYAIDHWKADAV